MNEEIEQYVRNHSRDFMELLCQIISIPSPTGHEQAKGEWILNLLHQWGAAGAYRDAAGNVVYPCHVKSGEKVALYTAHIDTVFQDLQEIHIRQTGHILSAPSCSDNSASIAGLLFIIKMFHDLQLTPKCSTIYSSRRRRVCSLPSTSAKKAWAISRGCGRSWPIGTTASSKWSPSIVLSILL